MKNKCGKFLETSKSLNTQINFSFSHEQSEYFGKFSDGNFQMENFLIIRSSTKVKLKDILMIYELYVKNH